jgi:hypothetical protein
MLVPAAMPRSPRAPHRGPASGVAWSVGGVVLVVAGTTVSYVRHVFAGR